VVGVHGGAQGGPRASQPAREESQVKFGDTLLDIEVRVCPT
jgi:hypothetical protein